MHRLMEIICLYTISIKMTKKSIILLFFILLFCSSKAQQNIPIKLCVIPEEAIKTHINYSDEILMLQKGIIKKYNSSGLLMNTYGNLYIDEYTEIISNNSFRTFLYCPNYGKIILLDKRFGEIDIIDVFALNNILVGAVGISYDNEFLWLWDIGTQKLVKINQQGKVIFTTPNISQWTGTSLQVNTIQEIGTQLLLNDKSQGIFIFDNNGTYQKQLPIKDACSISKKEQLLVYNQEGKLMAYDQLSFSTIEFTNAPNLYDISVGKNILCGTNADNEVEVWQY